MKHLLFVLLITLAANQIYAQSYLYLGFHNNSVREIELSSFSKMTFSNGSVRFTYNNQSFDDFLVSELTRIAFAPENLSGIEESITNQPGTLFPNPANWYVRLMTADKEVKTVSIFTMQGILVRSFEYESDEQMMDISELTAGVYLVKAGKQTFKLVKK